MVDLFLLQKLLTVLQLVKVAFLDALASLDSKLSSNYPIFFTSDFPKREEGGLAVGIFLTIKESHSK